MLDTTPFTFKVTDLKQFTYCGRILYYQTILPQVRPTTYKMEEGVAAHSEVEGRERRRSLTTYGLSAGARHFNLPLYAPTLQLSGELDMLIETDDELIPVDYKNARTEGPHYHLQLMAYGRLLELTWPDVSKPVRRGFLYLIPGRRAIEVPFTPALRQQLQTALAEMTAIARAERMPPATSQRRRCVDCEFRRFCNDVL